MKKCPECAEEIQDEAIKCKHCKSLLTVAEERNFFICSFADSKKTSNKLYLAAKDKGQIVAYAASRGWTLSACEERTLSNATPLDISKQNGMPADFKQAEDIFDEKSNEKSSVNKAGIAVAVIIIIVIIAAFQSGSFLMLTGKSIGRVNGVTLAQYESITTGMSLSEVEQILGRGKSLTSMDMMGSTTDMYVWNTENGQIQITFSDKRVFAKSLIKY